MKEEKILLEITEEEFVVIMSALYYVKDQYEIRTPYTEFSKSSALTDRAACVYKGLHDRRFEEIYDRHLRRYYGA